MKPSNHLKPLMSLLFLLFSYYLQAQYNHADSAKVFISDWLNRCHQVSIVYEDANSPCNIFIPFVEGDILGFELISQQNVVAPQSGRSSGLLIYKPNPAALDNFSSWRYTYGPNNFGDFKGLNMEGTKKLVFWLKGKGTIEISIGGTNRAPYYNSAFAYQDGVDARSSGCIELDSVWTRYELDLTDQTFYVFKGVCQGLNNRFPAPVYLEDPFDCHEKLQVIPESTDETGYPCFEVIWEKSVSSMCWGGFFLVPPGTENLWWEDQVQGYDLSGLDTMVIIAKMSKPGKVRFLFGRENDSSHHKTKEFTLDTTWTTLKWVMPSVNYSAIVAGFGLALSPDIGTPDSVSIYIDKIYYKGAALAHDFSNLITGFNIIASEALNPDSAVIEFDNVYFDRPRLDEPVFPSSFIIPYYDTLYASQQLTSHIYDAALTLIALLAEFHDSNDSLYLWNAQKIGNAFLYAMDNDQYFNDGRLLNVYAAGLHYNYLGQARRSGYYREDIAQWIEDEYDVSTSTGNIAWAGLAILSLYETTNEERYLEAAEILAQWCIDHTWADRGFSAGYLGWDGSQIKLEYTANEHCIDLHALFMRLFKTTHKELYLEAALHADNFVKEMWDASKGVFYTGTDYDGNGINTSVIPADIQFWYIMAFQDPVSNYTRGYWWAKENCRLENFQSINFPNHLLTGYDFSFIENGTLDGVAYEFTNQGAIGACMVGDTAEYHLLLSETEHVQTHGERNNGAAIIAADHDRVSTGFNWEYHNILHAGAATCWYLFAKERINPYYHPSVKFDCLFASGLGKPELSFSDNFSVYPNPATDELCILFLLSSSKKLTFRLYDMRGRLVKNILTNKSFLPGTYKIPLEGKNASGQLLPGGMYLISVHADEIQFTKKIVILP